MWRKLPLLCNQHLKIQNYYLQLLGQPNVIESYCSGWNWQKESKLITLNRTMRETDMRQKLFILITLLVFLSFLLNRHGFIIRKLRGRLLRERHWVMYPPCWWRKIKRESPERVLSLNSRHPTSPPEPWDQQWQRLGQANHQPWNIAPVPMFLKSATDPFYCLFLWEWQFNQRIHWSPCSPDSQSSLWQHN